MRVKKSKLNFKLVKTNVKKFNAHLRIELDIS